MAALVPDEGEVLVLQYITNMVSPGNLILHLYSAPTGALSDSASLATFTENTEAGYAPVTLSAAGWTTTLAGGVATVLYSSQSFVFTTGATVYGMYITNAAGTKVVWCEKFEGSGYTLPVTGGTIGVAVRLSAD